MSCLKGGDFSSSQDYDELDVVGQGSYGDVSLVQEDESGKIFVQKKILNNNEFYDFSTLNEVTLLKMLQHPNIIRFENVCLGDEYSFLYLEVMEGDLKAWSREVKLPDRSSFLPSFLDQLSSALNFIHEKEIYHNDLKPGNILYRHGPEGSYIFKLTDFGISGNKETICHQTYLVGGTYNYRPPEVLAKIRVAQNEIDYCRWSNQEFEKIDIWALGLVCLYFLTGHELNVSGNEEDILITIFDYLLPSSLNNRSSRYARQLGSKHLAEAKRLAMSPRRYISYILWVQDINRSSFEGQSSLKEEDQTRFDLGRWLDSHSSIPSDTLLKPELRRRLEKMLEINPLERRMEVNSDPVVSRTSHVDDEGVPTEVDYKRMEPKFYWLTQITDLDHERQRMLLDLFNKTRIKDIDEAFLLVYLVRNFNQEDIDTGILDYIFPFRWQQILNKLLIKIDFQAFYNLPLTKDHPSLDTALRQEIYHSSTSNDQSLSKLKNLDIIFSRVYGKIDYKCLTLTVYSMNSYYLRRPNVDQEDGLDEMRYLVVYDIFHFIINSQRYMNIDSTQENPERGDDEFIFSFLQDKGSSLDVSDLYQEMVRYLVITNSYHIYGINRLFFYYGILFLHTDIFNELNCLEIYKLLSSYGKPAEYEGSTFLFNRSRKIKVFIEKYQREIGKLKMTKYYSSQTDL